MNIISINKNFKNVIDKKKAAFNTNEKLSEELILLANSYVKHIKLKLEDDYLIIDSKDTILNSELIKAVERSLNNAKQDLALKYKNKDYEIMKILNDISIATGLPLN